MGGQMRVTVKFFLITLLLGGYSGVCFGYGMVSQAAGVGRLSTVDKNGLKLTVKPAGMVQCDVKGWAGTNAECPPTSTSGVMVTGTEYIVILGVPSGWTCEATSGRCEHKNVSGNSALVLWTTNTSANAPLSSSNMQEYRGTYQITGDWQGVVKTNEPPGGPYTKTFEQSFGVTNLSQVDVPGAGGNMVMTYYVDDGGHVTPDPPVASCSVSTNNVTMDHGTQMITAANNHQVIEPMDITCTGNATATVDITGGKNNSDNCEVSLTNGATSYISVSQNKSAWYRTMPAIALSGGANHLYLRSILNISNQTNGGYYTGSAVVTININ
ncbi:hypothetical protein CAM18_22990 [Salmonella enterica]|nr:hypothetical protein [Salmonella enterica]ECO1003995.1 hypothetical protein [Salmonella enterica subsp. enterica serovar Give]ECS8314108.1 hypothetical protein [Salmonella enterica subsp. enterica serovar Panama]ECT7813258.1 hypothetical protein [Salmonella enterica subsp. enterica serovar 9,12:-:1,5]EAR3991712.1 hypothetical protein [Salmonella enterica]